MRPDDLNPADLDEVVAILKTGGARSVDFDPAKVNTPGVWIRHDGYDLDVLAGATINLTLHLITTDGETGKVQARLADLFNQLHDALDELGGPVDRIRVVGVVLPGSQTPLPALAVPVSIHTTQE